MTRKLLCVSFLMGSGMVPFADSAIQAQIGTGTGSSGAVGQGGPEITRPEKGGEKGRPEGSGTTEQAPDAPGRMRPEGAIIMKPKPGEAATPGSGRPPDRSTPHTGKASSGGTSSGMGSEFGSGASPGDTGSSSGRGDSGN